MRNQLSEERVQAQGKMTDLKVELEQMNTRWQVGRTVVDEVEKLLTPGAGSIEGQYRDIDGGTRSICWAVCGDHKFTQGKRASRRAPRNDKGGRGSCHGKHLALS